MPFIGKQSTSNSQITNYTTTVGSGGQTNFTVIIEGGDETHVYLNGVLLKETTDYTVSSTQISLVSPAVENDIVEIKVFRSFALVDAVKASEGGTFSGNVAVNGDLTVDTSKLKVDSSGGHIGIGTASPTTFSGYTTVHHKNASGDAINLTETDGGVISQEIVTDSSSGSVLIGARSNHPLKLTVNDSEKVRITTSGNVEINDGDLKIGTAGHGIIFSGFADANRLDDYEEGIWTPANNSGGFGYTSNGYYTKIGRLVHVQWEGTITGTATAGVYLQIGGLPFSATVWSVGSMYCQYYSDEGTQQLSAAVGAGSTVIKFVDWGSEALASKFQAGYFAINITYTTS